MRANILCCHWTSQDHYETKNRGIKVGVRIFPHDPPLYVTANHTQVVEDIEKKYLIDFEELDKKSLVEYEELEDRKVMEFEKLEEAHTE